LEITKKNNNNNQETASFPFRQRRESLGTRLSKRSLHCIGQSVCNAEAYLRFKARRKVISNPAEGEASPPQECLELI